ncbi:DNA cytosine methyltransferase [Vibrio harveyi]|nr:DNA cytosine methyltransferase [Vibrio harveyi]
MIITKTLRELGYIIPKEPLILSPHDFGIPQERQRVFIPGVLREKTNITDNEFMVDFKKEMYNNPLNSSDIKSIKKYIFDNFLEKKVDKKYFLDKNVEKDKYLIHVFNA